MIGLDDPLTNGSTIREIVNHAREQRDWWRTLAEKGGSGSKSASQTACTWTGKIQGYFTLLQLLGIIDDNEVIGKTPSFSTRVADDLVKDGLHDL